MLILPVVTNFTSNTNSSLIPPIDQLLAIDCASPGCSNSTITSLIGNITQGCSAELAKYNISSSLITTVAQQYPLAREVVCLRTNDTSAITNSTSTSNSTSTNSSLVTNGIAYCATSLLSTLSTKVNSTLTIPFLVDLYKSYQNNTLIQYASYFSAEDLCDTCIFAAADVIGAVYPQVGNLTLGNLGFSANGTNNTALNNTISNSTISLPSNPAVYNTSIAQALNSTCSADGLTWNSNGTLPEGITQGANNSSFGVTLFYGNETFTPVTPAQPIGVNATRSNTTSSSSAAASATASAPARRNVADIKARWVGQI